jgi:hypothetical protein
MFPITPEQRLWLVEQRQAQLIHEAEQQRIAAMGRADTARRQRSRLLDTVFGTLGGRLAALRAALLNGNAGPKDPCCDNAVG